MDSPLLLRALRFAADRHSARRRPYINQPIEVAALIAESGVGDEEVVSRCRGVNDPLERRFDEELQRARSAEQGPP